MSFTTEIKTQDKGFVCVRQMMDFYGAVWATKKENKLISTRPETDKKVAEVTAQQFAENNKIPYSSTILQEPFITLVEEKGKWYPALVDKKEVTIIYQDGKKVYGGTFTDSFIPANMIALFSKKDFMPAFGKYIKSDKV